MRPGLNDRAVTICGLKKHMKKYFLTFFLFTIIVAPVIGFAEDSKDQSTHLFNIQGGVFLPAEDASGVGYNILTGYDYIFPIGLSVGFETGYKSFERKMLMDIVTGPADTKIGEREANAEISVVPILLNLKYHFLSDKTVKPYLGVGMGAILSWVDFTKFDNISDDEGLTWADRDKSGLGFDLHGLAGVRFKIIDRLSLFVEARYSYEVQIQERADDETDVLNLGGFYGNGGICYYFGTKKAAVAEKPKMPKVSDSDNDGVPDDKDKCPDTPKGVKVDAKGCPLDSDGDGVADYLDKCPDTPKDVKVDENGCPLDSDGDGVPDYLDKCPDTPKGMKVDAKGCPLDSDGDGVADHLDKCPDTPKGVKVDENGCPLDSDGDGVADHLDKCPDTPKGVKVDENGCPLDSDGDGVADYLDKCPDTPKGVKVDAKGCFVPQKVSIRLNIKFDFDKSYIKPTYHDEISKVANFMRKYPWTMVYIDGHSDNMGSEAYNVRLSQRRADSVKQYLIDKLEIKDTRLETMGFGFRKPIADNATEEGRQKNRRIEAVIETLTKP